MKTSGIFLLTLSGILIVSCGNSQKKKQIAKAELSDDIRINQVGYYLSLGKRFTVADGQAESFMLVDSTGEIVFRGTLSEYGLWEPSGEMLKLGDFSEFNQEGKYFIHIPDAGNSYLFQISDKIYENAAVDALETFYFMRASMDMDEEYLGKFSRKAGHPDDTCWYHESTGYREGFISSPGGWYDAGDYGKYIVNASISTGTMLLLYEMFPDVFPDGTMNFPEKNNGKNDLLDEMKYEFDWVLTMQDTDGGVFHKLTALRHDGITMPDKTLSKRYIFAKSTAASLGFAAMLAQASRLYRSCDPEFASRCLDAATRAYEWALKNPDKYFSNPPGVNTGGYGDRELAEEFFWAAAELYCTTGEHKYFIAVRPGLGNIRFRITESWRNYVDNIGYYSLFLYRNLDENERMLLEDGIIRLADKHLDEAKANPYGTPISHFEWGSNSDVLNTAIIQIIAHRITGDQKYLEATAMITDYIFGRNATGYSFVSGYGSKYSRNFHHRLLWADENEEPFPGYVAGGPNGYMQDKGSVESSGAAYPDTYPAKAYIDHTASYASNEICINWNAPLVAVLAYLNRQLNDVK
jgi:endoglucanase